MFFVVITVSDEIGRKNLFVLALFDNSLKEFEIFAPKSSSAFFFVKSKFCVDSPLMARAISVWAFLEDREYTPEDCILVFAALRLDQLNN